jgi:hypothetical protein
MSLLSVYVEGAKDTSAQGVRRLADLIAARYGLATDDLEKRLTIGRFRVKANVDAATAQAFAADLEALGARCSIAAVEGANPARGLKGMPALEQPAAVPALDHDRAPASARAVPALSGEMPARRSNASSSDDLSGRALTPNSARTITASAVPPPTAARTTSGAPGSPGSPARPTTGSSAALRPASGLSAATVVVREPDNTLNPSTVRMPSSGLSAATGFTAATREPDVSSLNPPTLRGLSTSPRTPAHSMPPMSDLPAASRTTTLPFAGMPRAGSPSGAPSQGGGGLAAALADATYNHSSGLGALDGASFSLSTLDGHDDHSPPATTSPGAAAGDRGLTRSMAASLDEDVDYEPDDSATPTTSFDDAPAHATPPGYDSYPPRRPSSGSRQGMPLRPATSPGSTMGSAMGSAMGGTSTLMGSPAVVAPASRSHQATAPQRPTPGPAPSLRLTPGAPPTRTPATSQPPVDLFAPPEDDGPQQLHLVEELRPPRRSSLAPEGAPMMAPAVAPAVAPPFVPRAGSDASTARRLQARLRVAFAIGIFAAALIGFIPAHLVAKARERSAYERIDNRARIAQSEITTVAEWNSLDDVRTALSRQKHAAHQEIALLSILLWVGISGALSFSWIRFGLPRFEPGHGEREH